MVQFAKSVYVSIAYRYWNPEWTEARNRQCYGANASPEGVGGNWRIELNVASHGGIEPDLSAALAVVKSQVDHRCLWLDIEEFATQPSTLENVSVYLAGQIFTRPLDGASWTSLTIYENEKWACTVFPDRAEVRLSCRVANLTFYIEQRVNPETGMALDRELLTQEVKGRLAEPASQTRKELWAGQLFSEFKTAVKGLMGLRVDLGRHGAIEVKSAI